MAILKCKKSLIDEVERISEELGVTTQEAFEAVLKQGLVAFDGNGHLKDGWNLNEITFLSEWYLFLTDSELGKALSKEESDISQKRRELQLSKRKGRRSSYWDWRVEEEAFVSENWKNMTDEEMALQLGRTVQEIAAKRCDLKLRRNGKRWLIRQRLFTEDDIRYIRDHWEEMTDEEMAKQLDKNVLDLIAKRSEIGLRRHIKKSQVPVDRGDLVRLKYQGFADKVDSVWLKKALNNDGHTLEAVGDVCGVSRERVRQVAKRFGIDVNAKTPMWHARHYGDPKLGDKEWVEEQLIANDGSVATARALCIEHGFFSAQITRLGIAESLKKKSPAPTAEATCEWCGGKIIRRKSTMRGKRSFCNKTCQGKWLGKNHGGSGPGSKSAETEEEKFIREHYEEMTDEEIARILDILKGYVRHKRLILECFREGEGWDDGDIEFIEERYVDLSDIQIGKALGKPTFRVKAKRLSLGLSRRCIRSDAWSEDEIQYLRDNYRQISRKEMSKALGRTISAIATKRQELGLLIFVMTPWSEEEVAYLRENWLELSDKEMASELKRPLGSVFSKRRDLGLRRSKSKWKEWELEFLASNYETMSGAEISRVLHKSTSSVYNQISRLKQKEKVALKAPV